VHPVCPANRCKAFGHGSCFVCDNPTITSGDGNLCENTRQHACCVGPGEGMGQRNDKKRAAVLRRRHAAANKNVEEAITEIARYQEALREVVETGDEDLECDVLADGVDVVVDGRQWMLAVYPDGWAASYEGFGRDEPDIDGRLGPADMTATELVYRLRT